MVLKLLERRNQAVNFIALLEQQLREVATVLTGHPGNECHIRAHERLPLAPRLRITGSTRCVPGFRIGQALPPTWSGHASEALRTSGLSLAASLGRESENGMGQDGVQADPGPRSRGVHV